MALEKLGCDVSHLYGKSARTLDEERDLIVIGLDWWVLVYKKLRKFKLPKKGGGASKCV